MVAERHSKISFNMSWLEDLYEETVLELSGEKVTPLVTNPGRIMLTSSRIYFQPYNNVEMVHACKHWCELYMFFISKYYYYINSLIGVDKMWYNIQEPMHLYLLPVNWAYWLQEPVLKLQLSDLKYVTKRRYMLRQVVRTFCISLRQEYKTIPFVKGLECLCSNGECIFLVLSSHYERNSLYDAILAQPRVCLSQDSLEEATLNWVRGELSNYQYLMLLNLWVLRYDVYGIRYTQPLLQSLLVVQIVVSMTSCSIQSCHGLLPTILALF